MDVLPDELEVKLVLLDVKDYSSRVSEENKFTVRCISLFLVLSGTQ